VACDGRGWRFERGEAAEAQRAAVASKLGIGERRRNPTDEIPSAGGAGDGRACGEQGDSRENGAELSQGDPQAPLIDGPRVIPSFVQSLNRAYTDNARRGRRTHSAIIGYITT
jgi:hypothetical protein